MENDGAKVALIHSGHGWVGGAESVAVWTLQALKDNYDVTLFAFDPLDVEEIKKFYGTTLDYSDFKMVIMPMPRFMKQSQRYWYLKHLLAMRYCRTLVNSFDLWISTYYEMDLGQKGIQYVHSPAFAIGITRNSIQRQNFLKQYYRHLSTKIFKCSLKAILNNLTLVNSHWTAGLIKSLYDIEPIAVYPPVLTDFPLIPWEEREDGFVCIGRLAPDKRIETLIHIIHNVRKRIPKAHLHIVGSPVNASYYKRIQRLQRENSSWVFLEGPLTREELKTLVSSHKYGIHGKRDEHFGIAPAEMVNAGCIVFVPNGGGQVEIVENELLIYETVNEAVVKITKVMSENKLQRMLRDDLSRKARRFSVNHFMNSIRGIVGGALCMRI